MFLGVSLGTHDWNNFVTPEEMRFMIQAALPKSSSQFMAVEDAQGIVLDVSYLPKCMNFKLDSNDLDVNYIMHAVKRNDKDHS